jgi:hypothetical protein
MPPLSSTTYILAKIRRSPSAALEPIPLNELALAALGSIPHIESLQTLQCAHGELLVHFRWYGTGVVDIPAAVLDRYGLGIELDFVASPGLRPTPVSGEPVAPEAGHASDDATAAASPQ